MQKVFSLPLQIDELSSKPLHYVLEANPLQLKTLKEILQVEDVKSFKAEFDLKYQYKEHLLYIQGSVEAELMLESVVSLEVFSKKYQRDFQYVFDTKATYADFKEMEATMGENAPDYLENGQLDLADLAIEQLALALEDYPRKEGEVFFYQEAPQEPEKSVENPFSVLKRLKK